MAQQIALFNLAIAYKELKKGKSTKNLEQAITANSNSGLAKKYLQQLKLKLGEDQ